VIGAGYIGEREVRTVGMRLVIFLLLIASSIGAFAFEENPPTLGIGAAAPNFALPGVDGKTYHLRDFADSKVLVIVFTCNHCPTAQLYEGRIKQLAHDYRDHGVTVAAIQPNDPKAVRLDELGYTDLSDSFAEMKIRAEYRHFAFPYLYDGETQSTARKYGPTATPHVFIFDRERKLRYQGRVDSSPREPLAKSHDARTAIDALLAGKPVPMEKTPAFGCSIKWASKEEGRSAELARIEQEPVKVELVDAAGLKALRHNATGKVLLVDFWATWCGPCLEGFPEFETMYRMYRRRPFQLVTVSANFPDERKGVMAALERQHASSRNLLFGTTETYDLMAAFDPQWNAGVPYTVLIRPDGTMAYQHQGPIDPIAIRRLILANMPDDDYIGIRAHWSTQ
jgi:thiol-disulfide isomerase/thioredoxin